MITFLGILRNQRFRVRKIRIKQIVPSFSSKGLYNDQCAWLDLINHAWAVYRAIRLIWIVKRKSSITKLVHGLTADRFACVRGILLVVVVSDPH